MHLLGQLVRDAEGRGDAGWLRHPELQRLRALRQFNRLQNPHDVGRLGNERRPLRLQPRRWGGGRRQRSQPGDAGECRKCRVRGGGVRKCLCEDDAYAVAAYSVGRERPSCGQRRQRRRRVFDPDLRRTRNAQLRSKSSDEPVDQRRRPACLRAQRAQRALRSLLFRGSAPLIQAGLHLPQPGQSRERLVSLSVEIYPRLSRQPRDLVGRQSSRAEIGDDVEEIAQLLGAIDDRGRSRPVAKIREADAAPQDVQLANRNAQRVRERRVLPERPHVRELEFVFCQSSGRAAHQGGKIRGWHAQRRTQQRQLLGQGPVGHRTGLRGDVGQFGLGRVQREVRIRPLLQSVLAEDLLVMRRQFRRAIGFAIDVPPDLWQSEPQRHGTGRHLGVLHQRGDAGQRDDLSLAVDRHTTAGRQRAAVRQGGPQIPSRQHHQPYDLEQADEMFLRQS